MRSIAILVGVVVGAGLVARLSGQEATDPAIQAVLQKSVQAHGGRDKIANIKGVVRTEEGTLHLDGDKLPYKITWHTEGLDKQSFQLNMKIGPRKFDYREVKTKDKGWFKVGDGKATEMSSAMLDDYNWDNVAYTRIFPTLLLVRDRNGPKFTALTEDKFGDRLLWRLELEGKDGRKGTVFIDKATSLIAGTEGEQVPPRLDSAPKSDDKKATRPRVRYVYHDYLDVEGVKLPNHLTGTKDGKPFLEVRNAVVRFDNAIDPKTFERP